MGEATILVGDVRQRLSDITDGSVQCCVTSPPYWGLRDYGADGQIAFGSTQYWQGQIIAKTAVSLVAGAFIYGTHKKGAMLEELRSEAKARVEAGLRAIGDGNTR